jgi:hypothetical protein
MSNRFSGLLLAVVGGIAGGMDELSQVYQALTSPLTLGYYTFSQPMAHNTNKQSPHSETRKRYVWMHTCGMSCCVQSLTSDCA